MSDFELPPALPSDLAEDDFLINPSGPSERQKLIFDRFQDILTGQFSGGISMAIPSFVLENSDHFGIETNFENKSRKRKKKKKSSFEEFADAMKDLFAQDLLKTRDFSKAVKSHYILSMQKIDEALQGLDNHYADAFSHCAEQYRKQLQTIGESISEKRQILKSGKITNYGELAEIEASLHRKIAKIEDVGSQFTNELEAFKRAQADADAGLFSRMYARSASRPTEDFGNVDFAYKDAAAEKPKNATFTRFFKRHSGAAQPEAHVS